MSNNTAAPISIQERADILDVLRGLALMGVLLDNIFGFTGYGYFSEAQRKALPTFYSDATLGLLELIFIHGKFYSLFSLLFGIGFSVTLVRNEQKNLNPLPVFYRRLFLLASFGAAHLFLLWEGDILFLYAMIGCLLPLFRKCTDKTIITWAVILIASPVLIDLVKVLLHVKTGAFLENLAYKIDDKNGITKDNFSTYLSSPGSGWREWRNWQASGFLYRYAYLIESNRIPKVLGMFLLGFCAGRKMMYANLQQYVPLFKKIKRWGFIIGIPTSLAHVYFMFTGKDIPDPMGLATTLFYALSVVPLSLAYTSTICLFWIRTNGNNRLRILAPVGRMALTNYLMQTISCIIIFYGVGFGLGGDIGPTIFVPIALSIYTLQIVYSNWWFKHFNYGPLEWIWRQWTYKKRLPIAKIK
jgi:uncharacterized protein